MATDWDGPVGVVFDALAECRAILRDDPADALAQIASVLESPEVQRAMQAAGFFPERNDP